MCGRTGGQGEGAHGDDSPTSYPTRHRSRPLRGRRAPRRGGRAFLTGSTFDEGDGLTQGDAGPPTSVPVPKSLAMWSDSGGGRSGERWLRAERRWPDWTHSIPMVVAAGTPTARAPREGLLGSAIGCLFFQSRLTYSAQRVDEYQVCSDEILLRLCRSPAIRPLTHLRSDGPISGMSSSFSSSSPG